MPPPPPRVRGTVRWGLGDAVIVWAIAGLLGSIAASVAIAATGGKVPKAGHITLAVLVGVVIGQEGAYLGWLTYASHRKGLGSLRSDFGLQWPNGADWWALPFGFGSALVLGWMLLPITRLVDQSQNVVDDLKNARGATLVAFVVFTVVIAPVVEELFFRGLLLRSIQRHTSAPVAVALSALAFGAVHVVVGPVSFDPSAGPVIPALVGLGLISGVLAVRSGRLSRSVLLHAGFNLLAVSGTVVAILKSR